RRYPLPSPTRRSSDLPGDGPTTGVIWSSDGYIITSRFNFMRDPSVITVRLADGRTLLAKLVARDNVAGLALIKVNATDLPVAPRSEEHTSELQSLRHL